MRDDSVQVDSQSSENTVHAFWTGGWDSTFRIMDLVVHYGCKVQPVYVIDRTRRSWRMELDSMSRVRDELGVQFPDRAPLLAETLLLERAELEAEEVVNHQFIQTAAEVNVGSQYGYLALAAAKAGPSKIEISVHSDDLISTFEFLKNGAREVSLCGGATTFELDPWEPTTPVEHAMKVFEQIRFPFLFTHPRELERTAEAHGLTGLLGLSWTCQVPFMGQPCGVCKTCRYAIRAGKVKHFPKSALLRNRFAPILNPIWIMYVNPKGALNSVRKAIQRSWWRFKSKRRK